MREKATSCSNHNATTDEDDSDDDDNDYVPGNSSEGDSDSESEGHHDNDASESSNENDNGIVNSHPGSKEEGSEEDEEVWEENEKDELEVPDGCISHGLQVAESFRYSDMALAWEIFKNNPQNVVASIPPSSQRSSLHTFGQYNLLERSNEPSSGASSHVSGPDVNSGSVSGNQMKPAGDHVPDSGAGCACGGIVSCVGISGYSQNVLGVNSVPTDHVMIAASGDSSQNASESFPVKPPLNFEHDNDDNDPGEVSNNVTGWVSGLQSEVRGGVEMHLDKAVGDNSSLPPEHILYYNDYTFEEVMEFVLETPEPGIIGY